VGVGNDLAATFSLQRSMISPRFLVMNSWSMERIPQIIPAKGSKSLRYPQSDRFQWIQVGVVLPDFRPMSTWTASGIELVIVTIPICPVATDTRNGRDDDRDGVSVSMKSPMPALDMRKGPWAKRRDK
jgi:hypothetical protein